MRQSIRARTIVNNIITIKRIRLFCITKCDGVYKRVVSGIFNGLDKNFFFKVSLQALQSVAFPRV